MYLYGCDCEMREVHRSTFVAVSVVAHAFNLFAVVCAGSADLLGGCVGGSLAHNLIIVFVVMCVRSTDVHLILRRWASHASFYLL